ncbi:MAG TPA: MliC family protein [Candidatus Acidoferrales bacterium]|jgi:membrane-bound inhibitor of C-type lysozyme|nr:MliC family protein [Candidatus Acidoferrales bacterium]
MRTTTTLRKRIMLGLLAWVGFGLFAAGVACAQQPPSAPADTQKPSPAPGPTNNVRPAIKWKRFDYTCEAGAKITVYLHDTTAKVRTHDHLFLMRQTPSADGNRYSDGKVLWWGKVEGGFLQEDAPDGDGKILAKGCALDKPADGANP